MTIDDILAHVASLDGVLVLHPQPGDGSPEISWGDLFFYDAPDGQVPRTQPFATVVTKDYPDDAASRLDPPGRFRLNIVVGDPEAVVAHDVDPAAPDVFFAHPVYGRLGWVSVVNPGARTSALAAELLTSAHGDARARRLRRTAGRESAGGEWPAP